MTADISLSYLYLQAVASD